VPGIWIYDAQVSNTTNDLIDLRSDTVTRPSQDMRTAMAEAAVGDDVWGDDPTVQELEAQTAELLGKEAAMFVASGTQSNLCALMAHCQRGDEYIVGQNAHTYKYEAGGAAVLGSIQPQPIEFEADGTLDLDIVRAKVKPDDPHFARTRLLTLENTTDGRVLPMDYLHDAHAVASEFGLGYHLDGARMWNAAVALDVSEAEIAAPFDSVSVCLSKGLGAPVGSVLVGSGEIVSAARRWRKILGGGMRQAGILAAGGIHALNHNRTRLAEDHKLAAELGAALAEVPGVTVTAVNTNMVFVDMSDHPGDPAALVDEAGILAAVGHSAGRLVTHLDLPDNTVERVVAALTT
jgi:threonine aldolase